MSFVLEWIITLPLDAQLTDTLLLEDTSSIVIEDVARVFSLAFPCPAVHNCFPSENAWYTVPAAAVPPMLLCLWAQLRLNAFKMSAWAPAYPRLLSNS